MRSGEHAGFYQQVETCTAVLGTHTHAHPHTNGRDLTLLAERFCRASWERRDKQNDQIEKQQQLIYFDLSCPFQAAFHVCVPGVEINFYCTL